MLKKASLILRWVCAGATVSVLFALAFSCADIYYTGNLPANLSESGVHLSAVFSREIVAARLVGLRPLLIGYGLIFFIALIFQLIAPPKAAVPSYPFKPVSQKVKRRAKTPARILILAAALVFILLGVMNGGARDVLVKAINICTECIGLG